MNIYILVYILIQISNYFHHISAVASEEKQNDKNVNKKDAEDFKFRRSNRRFDEELNDEEWHVEHLVNTETSLRKNKCKQESFNERVDKYKKELRDDAAFVEFVSSDALVVNKEDMINDPCLTNNVNGHKIVSENHNSGKATSQNENFTQFFNVSDDEASRRINTATTDNLKRVLLSDDIDREDKSSKNRRSEYLLSSVEYYDEVSEFDESMCPDDVEVVTLQLNNINNYDVECEVILEWRSLE
ncbi:unnamed protein product [Parnassius apollo]|uniref:(apollo) hypothetical protein n=1 Tax=Parnassius apollo TaxID=110799 RepID=A0A8S3XN20_PARAO|nr:unnamed protein product [Parnassius apollo]